MSAWDNYVWNHGLHSVGLEGTARVNVVVLAWHETSATVWEVDTDGQPKLGVSPYLVKTNALVAGWGLRDEVPV